MKKAIPIITSLLTAFVTVAVNHSTAFALPRDPNGDGAITLNDYVYISQYLLGQFVPSNLTSLDFDQNGAISSMDAYKVMVYDSGINTVVPDASGNDPIVAPNSSAMSYRRHNCTSSVQTSYTPYTLYPSISDSNNANGIRTIIGDNDMIVDNDMAVVRIGATGTGFIIDDHIIATAAHCVYNKSNDTFSQVVVNIVDEEGEISDVFSPHYIHVPSLYISTWGATNKYDYALIYVDDDLSEYGKFNIGVALDTYANNHGQVIVSGFPQATPAGYNGNDWGVRFKSTGHLSEIGDNPYSNAFQISYDADVGNGQSGGPVYYEEGLFLQNYNINKRYKTAIGINVAQSDYYQINIGVRFNEDIIKFFTNNAYITA